MCMQTLILYKYYSCVTVLCYLVLFCGPELALLGYLVRKPREDLR